jgi:hypothetical protein
MADLAGAKRLLYRISPATFGAVNFLYRRSPYSRIRQRSIDQAVRRSLSSRVDYEKRIIRDYLHDDWTVRSGPFAGMRYAATTSNSLLSAKIIGSYESPIQNWIAEAIEARYPTIVNIGCAEGYYAVGFALSCPGADICAYDIDSEARSNAAALARLNGVTERVRIRARCTHEELDHVLCGRALVLCDIEGGEMELLRPDEAPSLLGADLIIETHEDREPGVTEALAQRFLSTHGIEVVYHRRKVAAAFPALQAIPASEHARLLEEGRPRAQSWMRCIANQPDALAPVPWEVRDG